MTDLINMGMGIDFYKISFLRLVVCPCHVIVNTFLNYFFFSIVVCMYVNNVNLKFYTRRNKKIFVSGYVTDPKNT